MNCGAPMEVSGSRPLEMSISNDGSLLHPLVSSWGTVPTGISIALGGRESGDS